MLTRIRDRRVSPASAIAAVALFAALGGTGYAAVQIDGKDIKNKSVAGKKLKNKTIGAGKVKRNTLTGAQINEAKLGTVPSAQSAATATSATNAVNATNAANAANVAGRQRAMKRVAATPGPNLEAARVAAPEVPLFAVGPFTVYGKCLTDSSGPSTLGFVFVKTSEGNAILNSVFAPLFGVPSFLEPGTNELQRYVNVASASTNAAGISPPTIDQASGWSASGTAFEVTTSVLAKNGNLPSGNGPYGDGDVCLFSGALNQLN